MRLLSIALLSYGLPAIFAEESLHFLLHGKSDDLSADETPSVSNALPFFPDESSPPVRICAGGMLDSVLASLDTSKEELMQLLAGLKGRRRRLEPSVSAGPFDEANNLYHESRNFEPVAKTILSGFAVSAVQSLDPQSPDQPEIRSLAAADPPAAEKTPAAKLMQLLTSNSFAHFATHLVTYPAKPGGAINARLRSPMTNLMHAFCSTTEYAFTADITPETTVCSIMNVVEAALACREPDEFTIDCEKAKPSRTYLPDTCPSAPGGPVNMGSYVARLDFEDRRVPNDDGVMQLPMDLPESVINDEGFMYFLLYRSTRVAAAYTAVTHPCGSLIPDEDMLPGWVVEKVFTYTPTMFKPVTQWKFPETPLMVVSKPRAPNADNQCQRVMTIRGTSSQYEWFVDLKAQHIEYKGIRYHYGFFQLMISLFPHVVDYFGAIVEQGAECQEGLDLIITGHSLGGALTNVLAAMLAQSALAPKIKLTTVSFAAPATFDKAGAHFFRQNVNGRNVVVDLDPIAAAPCTTDKFPLGQIRCNGVVDSGSGFVPYSPTAGRVVIDLMDSMGKRMEMDDNMGSIALNVMPPQGLKVELTIPPPLQVGVGHLCGYSCKLSQFCDANDGAGWECYKPDKNDAADGSRCGAYFAPFETSFP